MFTVNHAKCAMKVGTDGVLLGAWAGGGRRILDVGTGTGLIAMFMAQRFPEASVTAIDIEPGACGQARENIEGSCFKGRISVVESPLQAFDGGAYDCIVCNPPFFANTPVSKTKERTLARCAHTLPFDELFSHAARLLSSQGRFSVVIPSGVRSAFDAEAAFSGLYPLRVCAVKTVPHKPVSRYLLEYGKQPAGSVDETVQCLNDAGMKRSEWYSSLTRDFYL